MAYVLQFNNFLFFVRIVAGVDAIFNLNYNANDPGVEFIDWNNMKHIFRRIIILSFIFCSFLAGCRAEKTDLPYSTITSKATYEPLLFVSTPTSTSFPIPLPVQGTMIYSDLNGVYDINLAQGNITTLVKENNEIFTNAQEVGGQIYFLKTIRSNVPASGGIGNLTLFGLNLSTGEIINVLPNNTFTSQIGVETDGNYIAYTMYDESSCKIAIFNNITGKSMVIMESSNDIENLRWSPDGEYLIYFELQALSDANGELFIMNTYTGISTRLLPDLTIPVTHLSFSPDSKYLILGVEKDQKYDIYTYDLHNNMAEKIAVLEGRPKNFQWSPDGEYILYEEEIGNEDLKLSIINFQNRETKTIAEMSGGSLDSFVGIWSPDGDTVAYFTQSNSDTPQLNILRINTGESRKYDLPTGVPESASWVIYPEGLHTRIRSSDGMPEVYISAGEFVMGASTMDTEATPDEQPLHTVYLNEYWIDQHEVTNEQYTYCVAAGVCTEPHNRWSSLRDDYYGNIQYDNYPVMNVSWYQANDYCEWVGGRLPTEAEWEKAARGTNGGLHPWGNQTPNANLYNIEQGTYDTTEVCHYTAGNSPYGICDMAGNVWEWVNDRYNANYYACSPISNPQGAEGGYQRVCKGGVRSSERSNLGPDDWNFNLGFRCARSK
jgi:formylglycine-generating enzyme required for sulfatase activity